MRKVWWLLSGLVCLGLALGVAAQTPDPERIQGLIKQLADDSFKVRKAAKAELEQLGAAAVPALKKACDNPDPEVAAAARELYVKLHGADLLATMDLAAYYAPDELLYLMIPKTEQVRAGLRQMPLTRMLKDPEMAAFRAALRDKFREELGRGEGPERFFAEVVASAQGPMAVGFQGGGDNFETGRVLGVANFTKPERAAACLEAVSNLGAPVTVGNGVQARTDGDRSCAVQGGGTLALWAVEHHGGEGVEGALVQTLMDLLEHPPKDSLAKQTSYQDLVKWAGVTQGHGRILITPTILAMPGVKDVANMLGLRVGMEIQATESITKENGEHTRARVWAPQGQDVGGAIATLRPVPLTRKSWAKLPAGLSGFATYNHADPTKAFAEMLAAIRVVDEHDVTQFERDLDRGQQQFGVDVREELLSQIDGEVTLALGCRPLPAAADGEGDRQNLELPFTLDLALFCQVKKPDAMEVSLRHLFAFMAKDKQATLGKREFRGGTLYVVPKEATDGVHEPCFLVHNGWVYVGSTPESITQLRWDPAAQEPKPLLESARCKEALADLPKDAGLVIYLDLAAQAPAWMPLLTQLLQEGNLNLPPIKPEIVAKYMTPATLWVSPTAGNSIELDYRAPAGVHSTLLYGLAGDALDTEQ